MLAIIPAREGSKRLPGKNIKLLAGKPLIVHTIEAALKASGISRVIVSTDSKIIASIAEEAGAECPFLRPLELASDTATSNDVFKFTIQKLENIENIKIEEVAILQPTSPLRNSKHIDEAIMLFKNNRADSVISCCQEHHPIIWHKTLDHEGKFQQIFSENIVAELSKKPSIFPNGAIYILSRKAVETGQYYMKDSFAYLMDRSTSVDIDTLADFKYVEFLLGSDA